jgi:hypothetical protein
MNTKLLITLCATALLAACGHADDQRDDQSGTSSQSANPDTATTGAGDTATTPGGNAGDPSTTPPSTTSTPEASPSEAPPANPPR